MASNKLTVNKPGTQTQGQVVTITGTAKPGEGVTVVQGGQETHATANPNGNYGAHVIAQEQGTQTVSVSSTGSTTTTTYTVKPKP